MKIWSSFFLMAALITGCATSTKQINTVDRTPSSKVPLLVNGTYIGVTKLGRQCTIKIDMADIEFYGVTNRQVVTLSYPGSNQRGPLVYSEYHNSWVEVGELDSHLNFKTTVHYNNNNQPTAFSVKDTETSVEYICGNLSLNPS